MRLQSILGRDRLDAHTAQVRYPSLGMRFLILTVLGSLSYTRYYLQGGTTGGRAMIVHDLLLWQICFVPWVVLCPLVWWVERRFPVERRRAALHFLVIALASIPICYLALEVTVLLAQVFEYLFSRAPSPMVFKFLVSCAILEEFLYWSVIATGWTIRRYGEGRENERENARLALAKSELENSLQILNHEVLDIGLTPFFFLNPQKIFSPLAGREPQTADQMLIRLGDLLRASLRGNGTSEVTLDSELKLTRAYLDIE